MGLEPIWISPFDFKSNAYTNSAIRASLLGNSSIKSSYFGFSRSEARLLTERATKNSKEPILARILEAPTGIEPVYKVLQTSA